MPNNCLFLVDTYDTIAGVRNAIEVGKWLKENGHHLLGVRLDSGDLAYLSIEARRLLDEAGFTDAMIIATNDLDENIITSLNLQGAQINAWGVGTKLITAYDQPAIGGVYKMTAVRRPGQPWQPRLKVSEQQIKTSTPGIQQVRRFSEDGAFLADAIFDESNPPKGDLVIVDPLDNTRRKVIPAGTPSIDLLVPVFRAGKLVYQPPAVAAVKQHSQTQLSGFHKGIKRLLNPHRYPVGLELGLHELRTRLVLKARGLPV
jgi:nicotinate phosphoribosyltransferase